MPLLFSPPLLPLPLSIYRESLLTFEYARSASAVRTAGGVTHPQARLTHLDAILTEK